MNKNNEILSIVTEEEQQYAHQDFTNSLYKILESNQAGFIYHKSTHREIEFNLNDLIINIYNKDSIFYVISITVYRHCNFDLVSSLLKTLNSKYSDFIKKNGDDFFINKDFDSFDNAILHSNDPFFGEVIELEFDDAKNNDVSFSIFINTGDCYHIGVDDRSHVITIYSYREQVLKIINSLIIN